jgi:cytochrome P450
MTVTDAPGVVRTLDDLPHASSRDVVGGFRQYARPGTHRSRLHRLGERFVVDVPALPTMLVTSSPEDAKVVLGNTDGTMSFAEVLSRFLPHEALFGDDSYIFLEGEDHVRERRRLSPALHGGCLRRYEARIEQAAYGALRDWPLDRPTSFLELGSRMAMEVMTSVVFGVRGERSRRLEAALEEYCGVVRRPGFLGLAGLALLTPAPMLPYRPLSRATEAADALVREEMRERRRHPEIVREDVMTDWMQVMPPDDPAGEQRLLRSMRGIVLAGFDTTATTLGWVGEFLAHHPDVAAACLRAVDEGDDAYLDAVIAEVMRLRPIVPMTGRRALRDIDVNGVRVPKGAFVMVATMRVHERPDIYDEPLAFRPERFVGSRPGTWTWLTFGGGPHRCLGGAFAQFEARVLLRTMLRDHTLLPESGRIERCRVTHGMLVPADGAMVTLRRRTGRPAALVG